MSFNLLAIRVLPECKSYIRKCLKNDVFYYFNNDYKITDNGNNIKRANKFREPINQDFFTIGDDNFGLNVNLQAIVGMNGDGKSSVVELMIRLLNNCICELGMNPNNHLLKVTGVCAELYFKFDNVFYCIRESEDVKIYKYEEDNINPYTYKLSNSLTDNEVKHVMFYTLVSNYSHYAYNTDEYGLEWPKGFVDYDENNCWLNRVFHKNDGYQTPIGLHPYRSHGNIDVNKERLLAKSRLSWILLSGYSSKSSLQVSHIGLEDKVFLGLKITDSGFSKLQKTTIDEYFKKHKATTLLSEQINVLKKIAEKRRT